MPRSDVSTKGTTEVDRYIGNRVRNRRLQLGLSQQKLADALGLTFPQVQKYENGTNRISVSRLQQIAGVLSMDVVSFFDGVPRGDGAEPEASAEGSPETRELVRAWSAIVDHDVRRGVLDLMKTLAVRQR